MTDPGPAMPETAMPSVRADVRADVRAEGLRVDAEDPPQALRQLGAAAHQLQAAIRAADHFNARDSGEDRHTGSWLMSSAVAMARELAADIDSLNRALRHRTADASLMPAVGKLRVCAHQLHAAARAADHFLDQESREGRETGSWLIAVALTLAKRLAGEIDDSAAHGRKPATAAASAIESHEPALMRRMAAATSTLRGAV